jgi:DNA-directed RNA polymerase specialized sigma24 family protein
MDTNEAITDWIGQLKDGDEAAAQKLWERYFGQVVQLARRKLAGAKRAAADEEDVALSTFKSLCAGAEAGRFPRLTDRDSLWSLLMAIVAHKSTDLIRHENRRRRGGTGRAGNRAATDDPPTRQVVPLSQVIEQRPTPEFAAEMSSQLERLIQKLERADDPDLLRIAVAKMMGDSNVEVAKQLGCVRRTVERKIRLIQKIWEREIDDG